MFKKILNSYWSPFVAGSVVFIYLQLQIFNLGIGFRDEGFLYLNAVRILNGEIPYRDFFMTTTPGAFYLAAFFVKLFGLYIIEGRILYFIFVIAVLFLVNVIYKSGLISKYVLLVSLSILFLGNGAIGYYNLEALTFALASFYLSQ